MAYYYLEIPTNFREVGSDGYVKAYGIGPAVNIVNGDVTAAETPKANLREVVSKLADGQEFINRWVFGNKVEAAGSGGARYLLSISSSCNGGLLSDRHDPVIASENRWDGHVMVCGSYVVHFNGSAGTPPYWRVYYDGWIMNYPSSPPSREGQWTWFTYKRLNRTMDFPDSLEDAYDLAMSQFAEWQTQANVPYAASSWPEGAAALICRSMLPVPVKEPRFSLEPGNWADSINNGVGIGRGFNQLVAEAYMDAFDKLPDLSGMNNAVNAIQLVQTGLRIGRSIISQDPIGTVGTLQDAWLGYRYAYGTTKSDAMEVASYLSRAADLIGVDRVHSNGIARLHVDDQDTVTVRCSIRVERSELSPLKSTIEKYGLQLDGYALWDIVPYSFMVDWFLDVGGALERARSANFARRLQKGCWCSIERRWVNEFGFKEIYYYRFFTQPTVSYRTIQRSGPSGATIVKRGLDTLALFTERR